MRNKTLVAGLALALTLAVAAAPGAEEEVAPAARHPDVGETTRTCDGCHAETTPEVHAAWYAGAHGLNGVKCFVCHGSRTERFAVDMPIERCGGCHAAALESMEQVARFTGMEKADCFSCHPPHRLTPHAAPDRATEPETGPSGEENGGTP